MQNALKPPAGKMITDFPTAPLAPGLRRAGGGTVEKSLYASHTEILTLPTDAIFSEMHETERHLIASA